MYGIAIQRHLQVAQGLGVLPEARGDLRGLQIERLRWRLIAQKLFQQQERFVSAPGLDQQRGLQTQGGFIGGALAEVAPQPLAGLGRVALGNGAQRQIEQRGGKSRMQLQGGLELSDRLANALLFEIGHAEVVIHAHRLAADGHGQPQGPEGEFGIGFIGQPATENQPMIRQDGIAAQPFQRVRHGGRGQGIFPTGGCGLGGGCRWRGGRAMVGTGLHVFLVPIAFGIAYGQHQQAEH